jgi:DNA-binding transcriptional ArsR family regulator
MKLEQLLGSARRASALLKAMSNEHRLMILCQLAEGEKSVGALQGLVGLSQSALSQHLARLRRAKFVKTRRRAQMIYYSLAGAQARTVMEALSDLYCAPTPKPGASRPSTDTAATA